VRAAFSAIMIFCACILVAATCSSASASPSPGSPASGYTYHRHYVNGQVIRYAYTELQSGTEVTAVARLRSYVRHGIGGERIKWVALYSNGQDLSAQARAFPPYDMSLDPKDPDGLTLPNTQTAGQLQNPVDDLYTFYGGLSAAVGIGNLHQPGQSYVEPTLLHGNFSSATAPVGQDLVQATTTLTSLSARQATFTGSFQPPSGGGLTLSQPWMSSPVCGSIPNNFELVQAEGSQWLALWGCESFTVTTVVDRASGQIISAQMTNPLQVDLTLCQDEALTACGPIQQTTLQRTVQLTRS
jgi:hypothetical protein